MTDNPQQPYGVPGQQQPYGNPAFNEPGQQPYGVPEQGSKYGTAAYNPGAFGQEMAEPKGWGRLKMLTLVSLAIYVVSGVVGIFTAGNEALLDAQLDAQAEALGLPREQLQEGMELGMAVGIGLSVVMLVIAVALYLVVFFGLRGAKNWARILGTVFAVLGALFTLFGLTGIGTMMSVAPGLGIVNIVIIVAFVGINVWWLVTAFSKDVNAYMRARG